MKLYKAFDGNIGPFEENGVEIRSHILNIMKFHNMHHVPSLEMDELNLEQFFLARCDDKYVGAAGYKMIGPDQGKTTLLAVHPNYTNQGIGLALQNARVFEMKQLGAKSIITNADKPKTIAWYKKQGYKEVGTVKKLHSFGWDGVDHWTTLQLQLC